jgi:hypothetical protein
MYPMDVGKHAFFFVSGRRDPGRRRPLSRRPEEEGGGQLVKSDDGVTSTFTDHKEVLYIGELGLKIFSFRPLSQ